MRADKKYGLQYVVNSKGKRILGRRADRGRGRIVQGHYCRQVKRKLTEEDRLWCEAGAQGRARRRRLRARNPIAHKKAQDRSRVNPWFRHVRQYRARNPNVSWSQALVAARASYVPRPGTKTARGSRKYSGGRRAPNPWVLHVKAVQARTPGLIYSKALHIAKKTYTSTRSMPVDGTQKNTSRHMYADPLSMDQDRVFSDEIVKFAQEKGGTIIRLGMLERRENGMPSRPGKVARVNSDQQIMAEIHSYKKLEKLGLGPRVLRVFRRKCSCIVVEGLGLTLWAMLAQRRGRLTEAEQGRIADICEHPQIQLADVHTYYTLQCFVTNVNGDKLMLIHPSNAVVGGDAQPRSNTNRDTVRKILANLKSTTVIPRLARIAGIGPSSKFR